MKIKKQNFNNELLQQNHLKMLLLNKNKKINNKEKAKKIKQQYPTHSKSKSRSISCTRSKQNVRYKVKTDQNISVHQDFRKEQSKAIKIRPFMSIQEQITGKQSRMRKNQSIIQNQDDKNMIKKKKQTQNTHTFKKKPKIQSTSQTCVLLNKKNQSQSILETKKKSKSKDKLYKHKINKKGNIVEQNKQKKLQQNSNQYKLRLKLMMKESSAIALQPLFGLNQNNLISVTSSSEIKFSSNVCSRKSFEEKTILNQNLTKFDQNTSSKLSVKKQYNKKIQAVTKIQKIWRGYQTRKLLQQYIKQQQPKLKIMLDNFKSRTSQAQISQEQLRKLNSFQQQLKHEVKSIQEVNIEQENINKKQSSRQNSSIKNKSIKQQAPLNLDSVSQIKNIQHLRSSKSQQIIQQQQKSIQQDYLEDYLKDDIDLQQQQLSQHLNLYRHQKAIYSHQDISDYIQQSRKYDKISQQESQQNIYQPKIIYQTNEQYIQSRKNSLPNKNINKKKSSQNQSKPIEDFLLLNQNNNFRQQNDNNYTIKSQQSKVSTKTQYKQQIIRIKQQQIIKWDRMINFIKSNFGVEQKYDQDSLRLLNQIIQQSQKNKKWLEENQNNKIQTNQTRFYTNEQSSQKRRNLQQQKIHTPKIIDDKVQSKQPSFKKKKLFLNLDNLENFSHAHEILAPLQNSHHSESKSKKGFDKSAIKNILQSKYTPLKPSAIQDIITLRQQMLTQRYEHQYKNLNKLMDQNKININEFYKRVDQLQQYIKKQKNQIEKSKSQIQRGLKVAANVVVKTQRDARILGKGIGLSRSAQIFNRKKSIQGVSLIQFNEKIQIMQERKFTQSNIKTKNFFVDEFSDVEGSINSLDLNQQQEKNLKQSLSSNKITLKSEKKSEIDQSDKVEDNVSDVTDLIMEFIIFQCAIDIFQKPIIFQTFNIKYNLIKFLPKPISKKQCVLFIQLIEQFLPETEQIVDKIYLQTRPSILKLLKSVRINLDESEDDSRQQNSTIIPLTSFQQAISKLWQNSSRRNESFNFPFFDQLSPEIQNFINKKERMSARRREDLKNKRSETLILQMKTIFDAWNQYLQEYKNNILMNNNINNKSIQSILQTQLVFSINQMDYFIQESKTKMIQIINDEIDQNSKICLKNYEQLCQNEANWTSYTKYAVQIGMEIEVLLVDMLFNQMCQVIKNLQN